MKFMSCQLNLLLVKGTTKVILNSTGGAAVTTTWSFPQRYRDYNYWTKLILKQVRKGLGCISDYPTRGGDAEKTKNNGFFTVILMQEADELLWAHQSIPLCEPMSKGIRVISALSNSPIFPDYPCTTDSIIWHSVAD